MDLELAVMIIMILVSLINAKTMLTRTIYWLHVKRSGAMIDFQLKCLLVFVCPFNAARKISLLLFHI